MDAAIAEHHDADAAADATGDGGGGGGEQALTLHDASAGLPADVGLRCTWELLTPALRREYARRMQAEAEAAGDTARQ